MQWKTAVPIVYLLASGFIFENISLSSTEEFAWVTPGKGIGMHNEPSLTGRKLLVIPFNMRILVIETGDKEELIGGRKGRWIKTRWGSVTGWVFSGFLTHDDKNWQGSFEYSVHKLSHAIKKGLPLKELVSAEGFMLEYYRYSRDDGNTSGEVKKVPPEQIDKTIMIEVENDGKGKGIDDSETKVRRYKMKFLLNSEIRVIRNEFDEAKGLVINQKKRTVAYSTEQYNLYFLLHKEKNSFKIVRIRFEDIDPG